MTTTKPSSLLEGTLNLPKGLLVSKLITNRAKEIQELEKLCAQSSSTKLVFQRLPKHLRRRAMSHNVKRLPRTARQAHLNQMKKSGLATITKRPSRKFRRRPRNLLQDYTRRQRQHAWLETHIWHAKRFRMINRWGYRLPFKPNDKAFRACYRASVHHCLIQDISYTSCIEISGVQSSLLDQLKLLTNSNTGLTIGAQAYKNGNREGNVVLYQKNCYPFDAIGRVKFMWKAKENDNEPDCLWFWVHPAFYSELLNCLIDIFELKEIKSTNSSYFLNVFSGTKLTELKYSLNRFRLTGPLAHSIIQKLEVSSEANVTPWFVEYLQEPRNKEIFNEQTQFWKDLNKINSTSELSPHLILNLIITDPRYSWPSKRTKAIKQSNTDEDQPEVPQDIKFGTIWSHKIRSEVSKNMLNTSELIEKRKNHLIPSEFIPLDAHAIPIMLVQQPGMKDTGYSTGWDIILPSNWGRPFWFNFVMWGGRAGGVKESHSLLFEQGVPDEIDPDTKAGETEEKRVCEMYKTRYFSLPPNKRINYVKYGIVSPFNFPWKTLVGEWSMLKNVEKFYVMRNKTQLNKLQEALNKTKKIRFKNINFNENCIVPVKLTILKKGRVSKFAVICIPHENDFKTEPVEPIHKDENQKTRKDIRDAHQKLLKRIKRQRTRAREKGKELLSSKQAIEEQHEKMRSLWLPEAKCVRSSCSREVFGFVTNGDFSFTAGKGQCIGYVALSALPNIFQNKPKNIVLVRDTNSIQYKLAKLEIICT